MSQSVRAAGAAGCCAEFGRVLVRIVRMVFVFWCVLNVVWADEGDEPASSLYLATGP